MEPTVEIMVACNDWRNGNFAGKASEFRFATGEHELYLESTQGPVKFIWYPSTCFQIGCCKRPKFDGRNRRSWVGNWCWDAIHVDRTTAIEVMRLLKRLGFRPMSGSSVAWRIFERLTT